jgi:uncharacterized delta-60 repeat protein
MNIRTAFAFTVARSTCMIALLTLAVVSSAHVAAQPGSVFPSTPRGHAGKAFIDIGGTSDFSYASALQRDGYLVQVGACTVLDDTDFCVTRYDNRLRRDASFGIGDGTRVIQIGQGNDTARAVAIAADGKIVIGGTCQSDPENNPNTTRFCVARLLPNGDLDPTFDGPNAAGNGTGNGNGKFFVQIGSVIDSLSSLVIQPDGAIVLLGSCIDNAGSRYVFCTARLNHDGSFDGTFDGPIAPSANGRFLLELTLPSSGDHYGQALAVQPNGSIVVAGVCRNGSNDDFCVGRLTPDGQWDLNFDGPSNTGNGRFLLPISAHGTLRDAAYAVVVQPDGKIVLAGQCRGPAQDDFCLARLNGDGTLDPQFAEPAGTIEGSFRFAIGTGASIARAITLQGDGKLLVAGQCAGSGGDTAFCIVRLHADGAYDRSFDGGDALNPGNGQLTIPMTAGTDLAHSVHVRENGDILLAGYCNGFVATDFCATELVGGFHGAMRCSLDIDGNGSYEAATDGVIAARIALGFRGVGVIDGLSFVNAPRSSWAEIRDFLSSQCGLSIE